MTIADHIRERLKSIVNNNNNNNNQNNNNINNIVNDNIDKDDIDLQDDDDKQTYNHITLYSKEEQQNNNNDKKLDSNSIFIEPNNEQCEKTVLKTLNEYEPLQYIIKEMVRLGCKPPVIRCRPCDDPAFGYYDNQLGVCVVDMYKTILVICNNVSTFYTSMRNTVMHEMIHAYDMCRVDLDPTNCQHLACTEIRAANLSGDCNLAQEFARGHKGIYNHLQDCVKRRAIKALEDHPKCKSIAESSVLKAWSKCNVDYSPFTSIPK
ncbi:hypothetical protein DFA_00043 [Cavenderia fasciculata]|uniref:Mitochondrial inner membrane protease ATP23 n=1 Tax=Cavenderia fasciculata TaxID=261658 RepID=F4PXF6_CACFS|nr:uncharacterized protein DFA_00043 [Cavenderia fasciculata]EGG19466.1 hypothetical protein DFA_00043 [Cavenderia fasciculata]|eukprot:XP_004357760.1 hypothetical protein DFA_00043 [Cavenderia fasciculata]